MNTLYLQCNMGAAGDMLTAALYELLPNREEFLHTLNHMGLPGVEFHAVPAQSCGISGTHMDVVVHGEREESLDHHHNNDNDHDHHHHHDHEHEHGHEHHHHHHHTTLHDVEHLIGRLNLPAPVLEQARAVYHRLAQAESQAHGVEVDLVHFHEVGALDAVADVAAACYALYLLHPDEVVVSPVHVGSGMVHCAHGIVPVPAPATAHLLEEVPCYGGDIQGELCTPTGAALLTTFATRFGPMPPMVLEHTGYGMGKKEFPAANCVRAMLGHTQDTENVILELVCNLDDMTPEALSFACQRLLEEGALDVYTLPGCMKKGRPGWQLVALCDPAHKDPLIHQVFALTSTTGLRVRTCEKHVLDYTITTRETPYGPVRVKKAQGYGVHRSKPEYEDMARIAREHKITLKQIFHRD
ncbi:nickel pincer cofactor biosynthesis protein LarC [Pseudoflavonifractor sp. An187]|uniref:nickel pincer cofactor biosynthesis protein LarC n=1 Tax=Pseudoflavonifractor sp. An187 TaxID=1965578 RepID=UPI000B3A6435|nr:nickel pincer cofactor biosynthesis protein LarC [Pseudoflavonifractor sp. An187]OUP43383.1 TIGR00299 family protein [Pseudoflavonifractor sp. An187]